VQASSKRKIERRIKRGIDSEYNGFGHVGEYLTSPLAHTHVQKNIFFALKILKMALIMFTVISHRRSLGYYLISLYNNADSYSQWNA
jgi:hypothetical protein